MSWAPGSLSDDGWAGSGDLALRTPSAEICLFSQAWALVGGPRLGVGRALQGRVPGPRGDPLLLARLGPRRAKVEPWDLALACQNRE